LTAPRRIGVQPVRTGWKPLEAYPTNPNSIFVNVRWK
jgi:hypothetical protein